MKIIRPITQKDLQGYQNLAETMSVGLTSLPKDTDLLQEKIDRSLDAFHEERQEPHGDLYVFVLEETETGEILGTSGIKAMTGVFEPAFYYSIDTEANPSTLPEVPTEQKILRSLSIQNGPTEICGLYLRPEYREGNLGRLLSYSRFLFIASHPQRFEETLIASMRGFIHDDGTSPFWDGLGRKFFDLSFADALNLSTYSREFIPQILPKHPIYVSLLPHETQQVIGITHPHTTPALKMLVKEGFTPINRIDIFDGGPIIQASKKGIHTIQESQKASVAAIFPRIESEETWLVSNNRMDFRACYAKISLDVDDNVLLDEETASHLQVRPGDPLRFIH